MEKSPQNISMSQAIDIILDQAEAPIKWEDFVEQVLELWPSKAKNPAASIQNGLRYEYRRKVVLLEDKKIFPVRLIMNGIRFRITLSPVETEKSAIAFLPWFIPYMFHLRGQITLEKHPLSLFDEDQKLIPFQTTTIPIKSEGWMGEEEIVNVEALALDDWLKLFGPQPGDSILVTIKDFSNREYILAFEPARLKQSKEIENQNRVLSESIYEALCNHRDDLPYVSDVLPQVYARLGEAGAAYPGDHWSKIVKDDQRLGTYNFYQIGLARYTSFDEEPILLQQADSDALNQVYCFKAHLKGRKSLWRRIEIRGSDTLGDFNRQMRSAFDHASDHLSEFFYKAKDRGRHARWEGYGSHNPFESRWSDEIQIAELVLEIDDQFKYVYDFGDWVEHLITLEEIVKVEAGVEYPRLVGKNKPRYKSCVSCAAQGENRKALWICIRCSNVEQQEVWLCKECLDKDHEEHYADEILY